MSDDASSSPDPALKGAGLSATGKTADQFSPGQDGPGTTYGDPGGTGTADEETTTPDEQDLAQGSAGNAEGGSD
ncbi:MAG: hypothetical protein JWM64_426 [Frankiales bacterium]|nr:hypothetical protein [Frankiales bacterium]